MDGVVDAGSRMQPERGQMVEYPCFGSGVPLLLDAPDLLMPRMVHGVGMLVQPVDDTAVGVDGMDGWLGERTLVSPLVSWVQPVLQGDEMLCGVDAMGWPLMHAPEGHEWDPDVESFDAWVLTHMVALILTGRVSEDASGSVFAPYEPHGVHVDDAQWGLAEEWVGEHGGQLMSVNMLRVIACAASGDVNVMPLCRGLVESWADGSFDDSVDFLVGAGFEAARGLAADYELLTGVEFDVFAQIAAPEAVVS